MGITKAIKKRLITKNKYNTLLLKYEVLQEELDRKTVQLNTERRINLKRKETWEKVLNEQEEEIINLKRRRRRNEKNSTNHS